MQVLKLSLFFLFSALVFTSCQEDSSPLTTDTAELEFRKAFDEVLPLPTGFKPEGIVAGSGNDYYVGSLADGSIYRGDFRTGDGEVIFTPDMGGMAVGLDFDATTKYLYVSGGMTGMAYVLDTRSLDVVANFDFGGNFVNDVIVTDEAAYFTDSFSPNIYVAYLDEDGVPTGETETLTLSGDFEFVPGGFNANGIEATPDGESLIVVNSTVGELYNVDPSTGVATLIDLGGETVMTGDGILLQGKTLYVVQNTMNQIAEIRLSSDYLSGEIVDVLTDPDFRVPTTVTRKGGTLYAVNARFDVAPPAEPAPGIAFEVVRVDD